MTILEGGIIKPEGYVDRKTSNVSRWKFSERVKFGDRVQFGRTVTKSNVSGKVKDIKPR